MKVFLSYSTNSHYGEARKKFAEFLAKSDHTLLTNDPTDPAIPIFDTKKVEITPRVDTLFSHENFKALSSCFDKLDLAVFFPGGENTIWMLASILHDVRCTKFNKPIIIVNIDGLFDNFINTIKVSLSEEPVFKVDSHWYYIANDLEEAQKFVKEISKFESLSSVVTFGDYVDYPVKYKNILLPNGQKSTFNGWRVIGITQGHVKLISAGTPVSISFEKGETPTEFFDKLTSFANLVENGFGKEIDEALDNRYTLDHDILSYDDVISINFMRYNGTDIYVRYAEDSRDFLLMKNNQKIDTCLYGTYGVRLVVTLKSDTKTTGKNKHNIWLLA